MKTALLVSSFGALLFALGTSGQGIQSLSGQQIGTLLANSDFVRRQIGCVLGHNGCDGTGNQIKLAIPEVLGRNCRSCTAQQASNARRIISFIQKNYPSDWAQIQARYRS
ncbi:hypothetical protein AAG570_002496 [Ranatra chinensis]|uniref:Uncharacterized protein n=1 Tax=Ranatra chinensis TaxID=642074 RepID=A0ABD0Y7Q7_9HEMI